MAAIDKHEADHIRGELQDAVVQCSERCLYQSAKWAAEMSLSLPDFPDSEPGSPMEDVDSQSLPRPSFLSSNSDPDEARKEAKEFASYLLAKSYFDCREFDRCAAVFLPTALPRGPPSEVSPKNKKSASPDALKGKGKDAAPAKAPLLPPPNVLPNLSQKSLFLALYAKYMSGEKRKDEESEMILGPADGGSTVNKELIGLGRSLEGWFADREAKGLSHGNQGWLEYLYGVVLAKGKMEDAAKMWLLASVRLYPYNWGAWLELGALFGKFEELQNILPELPSTDITHEALTRLESIFPKSHFLKTERALLYYHAKDQQEAEKIFSALLKDDPYRLDSFADYSNILYVMEKRPQLAFLAQAATATDKFRPETCCVVGNYYALKSEHEKAVMYFRRALTLDRNFLAAWTLMGHEYIEMKNTHAAIESYRRAVDINRKDYRAWYGLGQTYEVLEMHLYALYYYQRAASLRPLDPKMWQAVGSCFDKIDRPLQSIKAYQRALVAGTYYDYGSSFGSGASHEPPSGVLDPEILYQMALMHEKLRDLDEAASYMELTLAQEDGPGGDNEYNNDEQRGPGLGVTNTTSKARMWLARWEFGRGNLSRSMELANEMCQDGFEVEEAKALIRDLRARTESRKPL
ncbi:MAG: hypothetical protein Q9195_007166 [Heterodermia aff. obscurata]